MRSWLVVAALAGCGQADPTAREPADPQPDPTSATTVPTDPVEPTEPSAPVAVSRPTLPVLGGTLHAVPGSSLIAASDPESDRVVVYDTVGEAIVAVVGLPEASVPFRLSSNADDLFVSLRDGAAIGVVDRETWGVTVVPAGCLEPRGLAWDEARASLWLACADGVLQRFDGGGQLVDSFAVDGDLRDVVPLADRLAVSRFRAAEVLWIAPESGEITGRLSPHEGFADADADGVLEKQLVPRVAWRMVPTEDGLGVLMLHQRHSLSPIETDEAPGGSPYGDTDSDGCSDLVQTTLSRFEGDTVATSGGISGSPLAVDLAHDAAGGRWALVQAGGLVEPEDSDLTFVRDDGLPAEACTVASGLALDGGAVVAAAYDGAGRLVLQRQSPFALSIDGETAVLETTPADPEVLRSFELFHQATDSGLSCASCHPEGHDDGHVWQFEPDGARRTQNLAGGIASTLPLHWNGEFDTVQALLADVMSGRMGGPQVLRTEGDALLAWLDGIRPLRASDEVSDAVTRGAALFVSAEAGCAVCHGGPQLTSNLTRDVGTGEPLQAPGLLGVAMRGPWMHDGCALTLEQRFTDPLCGGTNHGGTIAGDDLVDLLAYLRTL